MPTWGDFRAWISIQRDEADVHSAAHVAAEYNVQIHDNAETNATVIVNCWVASESGKASGRRAPSLIPLSSSVLMPIQKFAIHWESLNAQSTIKGKVFVNGVECGGKFISAGLRKSSKRIKCVRGASAADGKSVQPFVFCEIQDGDTPRPGLVELEIYPVTLGREKNAKFAVLGDMTGSTNVNGQPQGVQLGASEKVAKRKKVFETKRAGPNIVKFRFKYQPIDLLISSGIATQTKEKVEPDAGASMDVDVDEAFVGLRAFAWPPPPSSSSVPSPDEDEMHEEPERKRGMSVPPPLRTMDLDSDDSMDGRERPRKQKPSSAYQPSFAATAATSNKTRRGSIWLPTRNPLDALLRERDIERGRVRPASSPIRDATAQRNFESTAAAAKPKTKPASSLSVKAVSKRPFPFTNSDGEMASTSSSGSSTRKHTATKHENGDGKMLKFTPKKRSGGVIDLTGDEPKPRPLKKAKRAGESGGIIDLT
ncbi:hypothetical protein MKEN_00725700 [Mycena kentingensis (nom. inval.)]|nr:hypothetical protein MKEN_00725700 [Mycena kentingensis (nom. inval.)]